MTRLLLAGDVNIDRPDPRSALTPLRPLLAAADIRFVNLEGPLTAPSDDPDRPDLPHKRKWRHSPPEMVHGLTAAGIDVVSCANNVTFPAAAARDSIGHLDRHGILHCGWGEDVTAAHRPALVASGGSTVGFLAYTCLFLRQGHAAAPSAPGVATIAVTETYQPPGGREHRPGRPPLVRTAADPADLALVRDDVARLRERAGTVVVSMHWGLPGTEIADYQREIARAAVGAGADVVVGHGPHVVHGVEIHGGKPILYSLGNAVFDQPVAGARGAGAVAVLDLDQGRVDLHLVPAGTDRRVLPPVDPAARPLADRVRALSALLGTTVEDAHDHLRIELS